MDGLHTWWAGFGTEIGPEQLTPEPARALASFLAEGYAAGARPVSLRQNDEYGAVHFETNVERPQDLANAIRGVEPIAIFFPLARGQPRVFALRSDFPDVEHQNLTPSDVPRSLCIDDRPWAEARLTSTSFDLIRRTQLWLAKAARGELHDPSQPLEPLFFPTSAAMIIPPDVLTETGSSPAELIGFMRPDNNRISLAYRAEHIVPKARNLPGFVMLILQSRPQSTAARMRIAPRTLGELNQELKRGGIEIMPVIKERLKEWAGITADKLRRLDCRLAIVVDFPTRAASGREAHDTRAFICLTQSGELGVKLGVLAKNIDQKGYSRLLSQGDDVAGMASEVEMAQVHQAFTRELAVAVAGGQPDRRKVVLVGAGAIGSQVAVDLAREGKFTWTVADQDYLLPHNFARHALFPADVAAPKAPALAGQLSDLLQEQCRPIICDVLNPGESKQTLDAAFANADVILDASASVAVSRHLSDIGASARKLCFFFNPAGTDAVLLVEDKARSITQRDLEAQYHGFIQRDSGLKGHLAGAGDGLRYSGSCRTLTNRIPATRAALLS
ncbi:MAG: ThiF family adenylyltransferase, partial [Terriglobales bacterium]